MLKKPNSSISLALNKTTLKQVPKKKSLFQENKVSWNFSTKRTVTQTQTTMSQKDITSSFQSIYCWLVRENKNKEEERERKLSGLKSTMYVHPNAHSNTIYNSQGTSLVVQWVRHHAPNAGGPGSIPGRGTRSHMHAATKKPAATTKIWSSQIKKKKKQPRHGSNLNVHRQMNG